jgi:hypothetical protein
MIIQGVCGSCFGPVVGVLLDVRLAAIADGVSQT